MKTRRKIYAMILLLCVIASPALAATLHVGPGQDYDRIEAALAAAGPGDRILVHPKPENAPYEGVALYITQPEIHIQAVGSPDAHIPLSGAGFVYSGRGSTPRAIVQFNRGADGGVLEGFALYGAHNESHNGAGVRINQANDVTIRNCYIHGNDMGIMSNGDGTPDTARNQRIVDCLIYENGSHEDPGFNHNLYLGGDSVTVQGCEIHSSLTGHNIKSRAHRTEVIACYIHNSANRELDLVDGAGDTTRPGSDAWLVGNVVVKSPSGSGNRGVIHFGQDGGHNHIGTIYLVHNTIVTPYISPVILLSAPGARTALYNNIVWDAGRPQANQVLVQHSLGADPETVLRGAGNWLAQGFAAGLRDTAMLENSHFGKRGEVLPFVGAEAGDYRLDAPYSTLAGQGSALPESLRDALQDVLGENLLSFTHPVGSSARPERQPPDIGAYAAP